MKISNILAAMGQVVTRKFGKQIFEVRVGSNPPRDMVRVGGGVNLRELGGGGGKMERRPKTTQFLKA